MNESESEEIKPTNKQVTDALAKNKVHRGNEWLNVQFPKPRTNDWLGVPMPVQPAQEEQPE